MHRITIVLAVLCVVVHGGLAVLRAADPVLVDESHCEGRFEYRTLFASAPERTDNWCCHVTQLADLRLLALWCSTSGKELDPSNKIWMSYSRDQGRTWDEPRLFAETTAEGNVLNPSCYTHDSVKTFIFYTVIRDETYQVVQQASGDLGKTWGARTKIDWGPKTRGAQGCAIRLRDGGILLPVYYNRPRDGKEHYVASVLRSGDGGQSWKRGGEMALDANRGAMEPTIAELKDGRLYCLLRTKTGWLYEAWSPDAGETWTPPRQSPFSSPESIPILRRLQSGNLLLVWNNNGVSKGANVPRYPLSLAMSEDDGQTWPHRQMIQTTYGERQLSNHGVFQAAEGDILLSTNHWAGSRGGQDYGDVELARFDEAWIRSRLSPEKWTQRPAATGGIRLDRDGLLLAAGAQKGDQTVLLSKTPLPPRCTIEFTATDEERLVTTYTGLFLGGAPFEDQPWFAFSRENDGVRDEQPGLNVRSNELGAKWISLGIGSYYARTKVTVEVDGDRVRYADSNGVKGDWQALPKDLPRPLAWGFFALNAGRPARLRLSAVKVQPP